MIVFLLLEIIHASLIWVLEFVAYPEFFLYPYLASSGFVPYRQIIDQHFPGGLLLPVNFLSLGFSSPQSFKVLLLVIIFFSAAYIYKLAKTHFTHSESLLAVGAFVIWQIFFSGNHLWFETFLPLFLLPAFSSWRKNNFFLCGVFLGLGIIFKQTLIVLAGVIALDVMFRSLKHSSFFIVKYLSGLSLPLLGLGIYLWQQGIWADFWFWTIEFNLTAYPMMAGFPFPAPLLLRLLFPLGILAAALVFSSRLAPTGPRASLLRSSAAWGLCLGLLIGVRPDLLHLQPLVPFLSLSTGLILASLLTKSKLAAGVLTLPLIILAVLPLRHQTRWGQYRFFDAATYRLAAQISRMSQPQDRIFLLGVQPHLYPLSHRLPAGQFFVYQLPWYLNLTQDRILAQLAAAPPRLIVFDPQATVDDVPIYDYADSLIKFMHQNYRLVGQLDSWQLFELNSAPAATVARSQI